jgi:hypothetical protein
VKRNRHEVVIQRSVHVLSARSRAATACFHIAGHLVTRVYARPDNTQEAWA